MRGGARYNWTNCLRLVVVGRNHAICIAQENLTVRKSLVLDECFQLCSSANRTACCGDVNDSRGPGIVPLVVFIKGGHTNDSAPRTNRVQDNEWVVSVGPGQSNMSVLDGVVDVGNHDLPGAKRSGFFRTGLDLGKRRARAAKQCQ